MYYPSRQNASKLHAYGLVGFMEKVDGAHELATRGLFKLKYLILKFRIDWSAHTSEKLLRGGGNQWKYYYQFHNCSNFINYVFFT
ncbi:hypothetical protein CAEBREN_23445 [Caenorhabditis brenneri]|uniref:Uncharacterized protein n=1 Tax=Caenorhabditis brenneri TaxID=135651 RepID=G0ND43_CAEBE|nr:hypothetical protein CAEBREN_23445 [Caenorhabditis brenneri]